MRAATKALHDALTSGSLVKVSEALAAGASLTAVVGHDDGVVPATLVACKEGRVDALRLMLEHHKASKSRQNPFDQPVKNVGGSFPIHTAAAAGHRAVVRFLVEEAGVDVDAPSPTETCGTALFSAIRHGDSGVPDDDAMLQDLVELGSDVNFRDSNGATPLLIACVCGKLSFIRQLLALGADPTIPDSRGNTPLHFCKGEAQSIMTAALTPLTKPAQSSAKRVADKASTKRAAKQPATNVSAKEPAAGTKTPARTSKQASNPPKKKARRK